MDTTYKYFAFISYSRKDSRAAAFIHRSLEHFRIPTRFVEPQYRPDKGRFLRPIFRDKRDLANTEGSFTEGIRSALEATRYLFVVCSRSAAGSLWVNEEVRHFLAHNGNDLLKVVPIVLEGNPGAGDESECLPAALRCKEITFRNLPTMIPDEGAKESEGWENGIVQALSYVLHVRRENIKASIDAERMRQMKIYLGIGVVCSFIFAALAFWAVKAERRAVANQRMAIEERDRAFRLKNLQDSILSICRDSEWSLQNEKFSSLNWIGRIRRFSITNQIDKLFVDGINERAFGMELPHNYKKSIVATQSVMTRMIEAMEDDLLRRMESRYDVLQMECMSLVSKRNSVVQSAALSDEIRAELLKDVSTKLDKLKSEINRIRNEQKDVFAKSRREAFVSHDSRVCSGGISNACLRLKVGDLRGALMIAKEIPYVSPFKSELMWQIVLHLPNDEYGIKRLYAALAADIAARQMKRYGGRDLLGDASSSIVWPLRKLKVAVAGRQKSDAVFYMREVLDCSTRLAAALNLSDRCLFSDDLDGMFDGADKNVLDRFLRANTRRIAAVGYLYELGLAKQYLPVVAGFWDACDTPVFSGVRPQWDYVRPDEKVVGKLLGVYVEIFSEKLREVKAFLSQLRDEFVSAGDQKGIACVDGFLKWNELQ